MREQAPTHIAESRTLPDLLGRMVSATSNSQALNWREAGYWRNCSTEHLAGEVRRAALGLHRLGLKRGEAVGILASPSPAWLIADLAIMSAGGVSVPLFPNLSPEHLAFESDNAQLAYLIVIGQAAWEIARPQARRWRRVIARGARDDQRGALAWSELGDLGDEASREDPLLAARLASAVRPDDVATIIHTSGSTGRPKGVALTHANLLMQIRGAAERFPIDPANDRALSCLPLAHVLERMVVYYYVATGMSVWFADDIKKIGELLREVRPTVMTMVPRLVEKLHARIVDGAAEAGGVRGMLGRWAVGHADRDAPDSRSVVAALGHGVADTLVYGKLRAALGGRLRYLIVGGAALAPELGRFLTNIGVPVYVGYGMTEAAPVIACEAPGAARSGSVGRAWPGVEIRIGARDEILARGAGVMRGYHRDPAATAATVDRDGWLHTGDCGRLDADGFLTITGRLKELFKTSNGKYVCPVPIEQALVASGLIDQAMVVAEGRPFVSALLFAAPEALAKARARHGSAAMDEAAFLESATLRGEVGALIASINAGLDQWEQVRQWRLVAQPPSVERDELTPTLKLKRHVVADHHRALIDAMYAAAPLSAAVEREGVHA